MSRAALAVLSALLAAGCGGGGDEEPEPSRTSAPPPQYDTIAITDPDEPVAADVATAGRYSVTTPVSGSSEPFSEVLVSAGCAAEQCEAVVRSDGQGRWTTDLVIEAPRDDPSARLTARYTDDAVRGQPGEATVELRRPVLALIGDFLALDMRTELRRELEGWQVRVDATRGRRVAGGVEALDGLSLSGPAVLAFSLFTNDDPSDADALESAVRRSVRRAEQLDGCAVWATVAAPGVEGRGYTEANAVLRELETELEGRLLLVPWAETVRDRPELLSDGVRATREGQRVRASLYAEAARDCA